MHLFKSQCLQEPERPRAGSYLRPRYAPRYGRRRAGIEAALVLAPRGERVTQVAEGAPADPTSLALGHAA